MSYRGKAVMDFGFFDPTQMSDADNLAAHRSLSTANNQFVLFAGGFTKALPYPPLRVQATLSRRWKHTFRRQTFENPVTWLVRA